MVFYCEELNLELRCKRYSSVIQKAINLKKNPSGRVIITGYHSTILEELVHLWEEGDLILPGKNNFESLGHFIFRTFEIRHTDNPAKKMQLKSIIAEIYKYRQNK